MAAGAPVVSSSAGGLAEVVTHTLTGLTSYPGSPESLAWAIVQTLSDPVQAQSRVRAAYRRASREYNWRRVAVATAGAYAEVVRERAVVDW
jgi:glycosyltransferase involved in cell wall biosynthesis